MSQSMRSVATSAAQTNASFSRLTTSTRHQKHDCILAIAESRGVATEVGLCFINMHENTCYLSQVYYVHVFMPLFALIFINQSMIFHMLRLLTLKTTLKQCI